MSSLTAVAEQLLAQSKRIDEVLEQHSIKNTSFEEDTLELLPDHVQKLRWDLLDTSHTFLQLLRGPRLSGLDIAYSVLFTFLQLADCGLLNPEEQ
jgi:hypothetical protein